MLDFVSGGLTSEGVEIAEADHAKEIAVEQADAKANQPQVQPYVPDSIKAVDTTSDVALARKEVMKYMLENDKTVADLKADKPQTYNALIDPEKKYPDDVFVTQLAERSYQMYGASKEAKAHLVALTTKLGLEGEVEQRTSTYNRFSNGASLTVAQGWAGVNKFLEFAGLPNEEIAQYRARALEQSVEEDQALFKVMYPEQVDVATPVGAGAPFAVGGVVGGMMTKSPAAVAVLGDLLPSVAVTAGKEDSEPIDYAIDIALAAAPVASGFALGKWADTKSVKAYDNAKEFEEAVKAEPQLLLNLEQELKDKAQGVKFKVNEVRKNIANFDKQIKRNRPLYDKRIRQAEKEFPNRDSKEVVREQFYEDIVTEASFSENMMPEWAKKEIFLPEPLQLADVKAGASGQYRPLGDGKSVPLTEAHAGLARDYDAMLTEPTKSNYNAVVKGMEKLPQSEAVIREFNMRYPATLAKDSENAVAFIDALVYNSEVLEEMGYTSLVKWAKNSKTLKGSNFEQAMVKAGVSGLLTYAAGAPGVSMVLPVAFRNWATQAAKGVTHSAKKTVNYPIY